MVDNPPAPTLATIPGVEIASVGFWDISNATDWHPSAEDLASAVAAVDCPAVRRPVLKFGHTGEPGEGDPAIGLVDELRLTEDGQTLVGDFVGVPSWLADADSEGRAVIASAYPDRSGEFQRDYICQLGHTHPFVVHAVALLGVMRPGIGTLESLYDLYAKAPEKEETVMAKAAVMDLAGTTIDQVRKAYYNGPGSDWMLWIREMFVDPMELIVQNDRDDSLERVPYTVNADGEVEFGDGQPVKVEYVNARATTTKPLMAFASRAEARPKASAEAEDTERKEATVATIKEGLVQLLGIPADADDEAVQKALNDAIAAKDSATEEGTEPDETAPADSAKPEPIAASAPTTVTLDRTVYDQLVANAQAGADARKQQLQEADERIIQDAMDAGKITAASQKDWRDALSANREHTTKLLASMPANSAVPVSELGHSTEPAAASATDDPRFKNWSF